jgi:hypothetical protein
MKSKLLITGYELLFMSEFYSKYWFSNRSEKITILFFIAKTLMPSPFGRMFVVRPYFWKKEMSDVRENRVREEYQDLYGRK